MENVNKCWVLKRLAHNVLCQYLISLLFFIVILILSLPYIKPFLAMLLLIHKILHCLTPDFPSVSFPAPSPPSPLHLVTWVFFFFFGSSDMQISCLQGFCTYSVCSPCCARQLLHVLGIKGKSVFLLSCLFHCPRSLAVSHFTTLIIFYLGPFFVSFNALITI